MIGKLNWQLQTNSLLLQGDLDRDTLLPLWQQRNKLLTDIDCIDVTQLHRVDSAGLALLVHLIHFKSQQQNIKLAISGISDQLATLIKLYNLPGRDLTH
ncbi:cytoplasmic protein with a STAS domain [Candidatus Regiella insecticola LSR1]|uniref:Cytoplasmic protein with a STAS domain n=1 Tax=Candidatus Regiella insecticola LSR1 TaxID=663321 RepID=E0WRT7_9ENTR|nr:lipid asymmetry maintenance protein MlaB [Candidatus Regiella insecticola]EFL92311.1 cytoplasmic protein with a STAS domain [Candidatus Regiella insecticola LSR1]